MTTMTETSRSISRALEPMVIPMDDHYPRNPENRYRIYRLRASAVKGDVYRDILGTTGSAQGIGLGLVTFWEEGEITDKDAIGVLDCHGKRDENPLDEHGCYTLPGAWVVNPYGRGGR